jgi:hypothetical protein
MKNIHVLPTEKPSIICKLDNVLVLSKIGTLTNDTKSLIRQNIYITSDEQIKEGDWFCNTFNDNQPKLQKRKGDWRTCFNQHKIILTTDQDLIKDGVQAIDDEFLEWFVKNPSCDTVKIESWQTKGEWDLDYKIIITKDLIQVNQNNPVLRGSTALIESYKVVISKEEPKQETLEEFSKRISNDESNKNISLDYQDGIFYGINVGAKWQAERMYSEEESIQKIIDYVDFQFNTNGELNSEIKKWFEQFKKK